MKILLKVLRTFDFFIDIHIAIFFVMNIIGMTFLGRPWKVVSCNVSCFFMSSLKFNR
jgi:hypothetical protein